MTTRSRIAALAALTLAVFAAPSASRADFSLPTLLSGNGRIQFSEALAPALSQDGRYAVFQGAVGDVTGVFRRDLQTGAVAPVAASYDPEAPALGAPTPQLAAHDAAGPSVSANGRYVAFTTTADLQPAQAPGGAGEPAADQGCPEVYVRDMEEAPEAPGAYTLASALGESEAGITYGGGESSCPSTGTGFALAGAQAAPGVALSADGRHVVFTVLSESNLAGEHTKPSQVAVRDLETGTTTLVTVATGEPGAPPQATPEGGAYPSAYSEKYTHQTVGSGGGSSSSSGAFGDQVTASSAAISADASTVAWLGTNVPAQVPGAQGIAEPASEVEPLWRRVADGSSATTKRLLGEAGLEFSFFPTESEEPIKSGALVSSSPNDLEFIPPALSADGCTVAMIANAPPLAGVESARLLKSPAQPNSDAYITRVTDSAAAPTVAALTATPQYNGTPPEIGDVVDLAISPDGTRVALDTTRTQFSLPSLALISPPIAFGEVSETYEANLALGTLQRVTATYDGSEPNGPATLVSFSGDGRTLAFASLARNLVFGDAIVASEVYAVHETPSSEQVAPSAQTPPAVVALPLPSWLLSTTAVAEPDGSVVVDAQVPGAGRLDARASAQIAAVVRRRVRTRSGARSRARRRSLRAAAARRRAARGGKSGTLAPARTVAQGSVAANDSSALELRLRPLAAYRALVARRTGLYAIVRVTFTAPGHTALAQDIPVTFRRAVSGRGRASRSRRTGRLRAR
jgi:Tol biopolymer transport system component